ncbi:hypothetical protein [Haloarcula sp. JP-L23]|uniref:hypothetical protein n=1 Tax=Haloarcula sp. JP-L23 TaxID=2716717 RepID=UPI00140EDE71|nr:hypothetical protein G9465_24035 [Haloarcula sp. JP-L23]
MDETIPDYERFERRQLANDRDTGMDSLCIDESGAHDLVEDLRAEGVIDVVPDEQLLIHSPSGRAFGSDKALAYFHTGWQAATVDDSE